MINGFTLQESAVNPPPIAPAAIPSVQSPHSPGTHVRPALPANAGLRQQVPTQTATAAQPIRPVAPQFTGGTNAMVSNVAPNVTILNNIPPGVGAGNDPRLRAPNPQTRWPTPNTAQPIAGQLQSQVSQQSQQQQQPQQGLPPQLSNPNQIGQQSQLPLAQTQNPLQQQQLQQQAMLRNQQQTSQQMGQSSLQPNQTSVQNTQNPMQATQANQQAANVQQQQTMPMQMQQQPQNQIQGTQQPAQTGGMMVNSQQQMQPGIRQFAPQGLVNQLNQGQGSCFIRSLPLVFSFR